jgi:hypothetical protein
MYLHHTKVSLYQRRKQELNTTTTTTTRIIWGKEHILDSPKEAGSEPALLPPRMIKKR